MNSVLAVIVTYNVDEKFKVRIERLKDKVEEIVVVDNGSNETTIEMLKTLQGLNVIYLKENMGIAYALNRGIEYGISKGYKWILTLDHDSIVTQNMISKMLQCYNDLDETLKSKTAMLVPVHIEEKESTNEQQYEMNIEKGYNEVLTEITSGALTKTDVYKSMGLYDEKLFIDLVDHDYCLRLNKNGLKVIQVKDAILVHNLGESTKKNFLGLKFTPTNHSALRRYYMTRNRMHIWNKYKNEFPQWVSVDKRRFITENIKIVLFEADKLNKLKFIKKGISDYKNNKFGNFKDNN